ncbi:hypothetical protein C8R47DRAFT_1217137 [Mycena vitilis]|nr:hypothetical protein C8R47DRAFT_1217137 [Mycena vitilis]
MSPLLSIIRDTTICQVSEELLQVEPDEIDKITTYCQKALDCVDGEVDKASTNPLPLSEPQVALAVTVRKILMQKAIQIGGRVPNVWGSKDDAIKIFLSLSMPAAVPVLEKAYKLSLQRAIAPRLYLSMSAQDIVKGGGNFGLQKIKSIKSDTVMGAMALKSTTAIEAGELGSVLSTFRHADVPKYFGFEVP